MNDDRNTAELDAQFVRYLDSLDPDLLAGVFERTSDHLLRRAEQVTGDRMLAEDVVQDTFLGLLDGAPGFERERPALPYLRGIVVRRALRARAWPSAWPEVQNDAAYEAATCHDAVVDRVGVIELARHALRALRALPEPYREVVTLFEHDLTPAAIGERLARDPRHVRMQVHRGLCMLRARLAERRDREAFTALGIAALRCDVPAPVPLPAPNVRGAPATMLATLAVACLIGLWTAVGGAAPPGAAAAGVGSPLAAVAEAAPVRTEPARALVRTPVQDARRRLAIVRLDGEPAPNVGVCLVAAGRDADFGAFLRAASDADGVVALDGVPPGRHVLVTDRGTSVEVEVPAEGPWCGRVAIERGVTVEGRVVARGGEPEPGAAIWLALDADREGTGQVVAHADAAGRFALRDVRPGSLVAALGAGDARPSCAAYVTGLPRQSLELRLVAETGALEGIVRDADGGAPIAGAVVHVGSWPRTALEPDAALGARRPPNSRLLTDAHGRFRVERLFGGCMQVRARARDRVAAATAVELEVGGSARVEIALARGARIAGSVVDAASCAVPGAVVTVHGEDLEEWCSVRCARDGAFVFAGVGAATSQVDASAPEFRDAAVQLERAHRLGAPLRIVLERLAGVEGSLRTVDGGPLLATGLEVAAVPGDEPVHREPPMWRVAPDGRFTMPALVENARWFVRSAERPFWVLADAITRTAGSRIELDLRVPRGFAERALVTGSLAFAERDALNDAYLVATHAGWPQPVPLTIDAAAASFRAGPIPAGRYQLQLFGRTGRFPSVDLGECELAPGAAHDVGTLDVRAGTLRYAFALDGGRPIEQLVAWVEDDAGMRAPLPFGTSGTVALRPGSYRLCATSLSFMAIHGVPFDVCAGAEVLLDLKRRPARVCQVRFDAPPWLDVARTTVTLTPALGDAIDIGPVAADGERRCAFWIVLDDREFTLRVCEAGTGAPVLAGRVSIDTREAGPIAVEVAMEPY